MTVPLIFENVSSIMSYNIVLATDENTCCYREVY